MNKTLNFYLKLKLYFLVCFFCLSLLFLSNANACLFVESANDSYCNWPPQSHLIYGVNLQKGETYGVVQINLSSFLISYTAPESGNYYFYVFNWDQHTVSYICADPTNCIDSWSHCNITEPSPSEIPIEIPTRIPPGGSLECKYLGTASDSTEIDFWSETAASCLNLNISASAYVYGCFYCPGTDADGDGHYTPGSCKTPNDDCDDSDPNIYECDECKNNVPIGSTLNIANSNLRHLQNLYSSNNARIPLNLDLIYNSLGGDGPLGKGWTHSYNISLKQNADGSYKILKGFGRDEVLYQSGSEYKPKTENYPVLTVNPDGSFKLTEKNNSMYNFDQTGKLTQIKDRYTNAITFTHTDNNLTAISDSQGRTISLTYYPEGKIETITDPNENTSTFTFENNNLTNITTQTPLPDVQSLAWAYTYHPTNGLIWTKTDPMNQTTTYTYNVFGRLDKVIDPSGKEKNPLYDYANTTTTLSDESGSPWIYKYDPVTGKLIEKTDPEGYKTTYTYETNKETVTDAKGNSTESIYDSNDNLLTSTEKSSTDTTGRTTTYTYYPDNEIWTIKDPENHTTTYTYEIIDGERIVRIKDPANEETETRYYADGRLRWIINPKGQKTEHVYVYDSITNKTTETITDFLNVSTTRTYDLSGNMVESKDVFNTITTYEYNSLNQLKKIRDYLGNILTTYDYYADGNLWKMTDANNYATEYKYNYDGKITEIKDALGNTTTYQYGGTGCSSCSGGGDNLISVTNANGKITSYEYYKNGWKKSQKDPNGNVITYNYDPSGFMTSLTDPVFSTTSFDKTDLVMTKTDPLGKVTTYVYDKTGRLYTKTDRKGDTITYSYTPDNVLETITYPTGPSVSFINDELDRITSMTDSLGTTTYNHEDNLRKLTVTDPNGFIVVYQYDEAGRQKEIIYPGNKKIVYEYDLMNRLWHVKLDWLTQTATYHYDSAGRLDYLVNFNGTITDYGYDNANRLTSLENRKSDNSVIASYSFPILDGMGNRIQAVVNEPFEPVLTPEVTGYIYNEKKNRLVTAGSDSFTYDFEGQISTSNNSVIVSLSNYTFDYEHRLTAISDQQTAFSYLYDGKESRLKTIRNGVTTYYIYDMSGNVLAEADGNKTITKYYVHGQGLIGMVTASDVVYSYHYNAIGSTVAITDAGQNVVNKYSYQPFGEIIAQEEQVPQPFKYVGQYGVMAEPNGFYYMRARYYDPKVGRFVSEDPIGFKGGTVNLYEYAKNNPVSYRDPYGLKAGDICHNILIKRNNIHLTGDDKYGHWWTEMGNESYGWWPKYPVDLSGTVTGVEGELNGQTSFGGTPTKDPHHGDSAEETYNSKLTSDCQTCEKAVKCIRSFANSYTGSWSWPAGQNCHSFQNSMLNSCSLDLGNSVGGGGSW